MEDKFPNENYKIIYAGKNSYENSVIQCLTCGRKIISNTGELFRKRRKCLCVNCHYLRKDTEKNREIILNKIKDKAYNIEFFMEKQSKEGNRGDKVRFTCKKCDFINEMWVNGLIKNNSNCDCQRCSGQKREKDDIIYLQELNELYPNMFTILRSYKNVKENIRVKCNICGFIRDVKPTVLIRSGYCPKCGKESSKGETKIQKWLENNLISYEKEKYFKDWNIGIHYFDFFLPNFNLVIEYHGIQHYNYNPYFHHTEENFLYRKEKDLKKKNTCIEKGINYLSIKYTNYNNIEKILSKVIGSTTIPQGSRGKCLEIESFQKEEDIVWT